MIRKKPREYMSVAVAEEPRVLHSLPGRIRVHLHGWSAQAKRVVEHLERRPGVRASVSRLTSRVLVEFEEHEEDLEDIISEITGLELPELPGEDHPAHPLDPGPLIQSATRTIGAALGLALHAGRQLLGSEEPLPGESAAV